MDTTLVQLRLETHATEASQDRYEQHGLELSAKGQLGQSPVAAKLLREVDREITHAISSLQVDTKVAMERAWNGGKGRVQSYSEALLAYEPEMLAFFVTRSVLTVTSSERTMVSLAVRIGRAIQEQLWMDEVAVLERTAAKEREHTPPNRLMAMRNELKKARGSARVIAKWQKRLSDLPAKVWSQHDRCLIGMRLLEVSMPILERSIVTVMEQTARQKRVVVKNTFLEHLSEAHRSMGEIRPFYRPMVVPPVEWAMEGQTLKGGYLGLRSNGLKGVAVGVPNGQHTAISDISDRHLRALNQVQSTPWVINGFVVEHAGVAFDQDYGPVPYEPEVLLPERKSGADWDAMDKEARALHVRDRRMAYDHNHANAEKKLACLRALAVAEDMREYESIWFPHAMDWRGRFYPIPQDLHPQGPDMVKSLLMFADAKPLGERGLVWLEQHTASTYGLDKHDRLTQQTWTQMNWERIMLVGEDPWLDLEFWQGAEEPWQFLAAAHELYLAYASGSPEEFNSRLPISVDGSCNGLQHLSAMGLDEVGGSAVNLMPGARQDIYQIVADKVNAKLSDTSVWYGKVTRKTVKRAVMTTPYGVTERGIATQIKSDGFTVGMEDPLSAANELKDLIVESLAGVVVRGTEVMEWLKECAQVLASDEEPVSWETPIGTVITQKYLNYGSTNVRTTLGDYRVIDITSTAKLDKNDQAKGVAPNLIHSFDAAHLACVALETPELSHMFIHDSFGTHACDVDRLLEVTKQTFVDIYSQNWFEKLYGTMVFLSKRPALPRPPTRGALDVSAVEESEYFFS